MSKSSKRLRQVSDHIQKTLATLLHQSVYDPRLTEVTITDVVVSPDLKHAKVYFSLYKPEGVNETTDILNKASGYFRKELANTSALRNTPALHFVYDNSVLYGEQLSALIDK